MSLNVANQKKVGEILVKEGKLSKNVFDKLVLESKKQGKSFLDLLESLKEVKDDEVVKAKGEVLGTPFVDLREEKITEEDLNFVQKNIAKKYGIIVFDTGESEVRFAVLDPEDFKALETIEFLTKSKGLSYKIYITTRPSFENALKQYENLKTEVGEYIEEAAVEFTEEEATENLSEAEIEKMVQEAPISKAVSVIMNHAVEGRASDVHIEPLENETRVRYRIDGVLHISLTLPKSIHPAIVARIKVLSKLKIDERRLPQDGRFLIKVSGKEFDIRVSTLPLSTGEKVVMRLLDRSRGSLTLTDLGLSGKALEIIESVIKEPYGMLLITGPTGSGKSTTLNAILDILNVDGVNIVTMEDPVEYTIKGVNQSQIRPEIGLSFANGLRSILRQDPDIIMVGEIRDKETAEMAIHSALTGHFLFSTLHTNTAIGAIPRMTDMGVEKFLLTAALSAVGAQRLVRKICVKCKKEVKIDDGIRQKIEKIVENMPEKVKSKIDLKNAKFYKGMGCNACGQEGYKGRIGIFEVLHVDDSIKRAILSDSREKEIFEKAQKEQSMLSIEQDAVLKILDGKTSVEEIFRVI